MAGFLQAAATVLLAVVLCLVLGKQGKETAVLLSMAVCCMVCLMALQYLEPVIDLMRQLQSQTGIAPEYLTVLLKTVGIGMIGEIAAMICADAGNASLGKAVKMLSSVVILWLAVPLFENLMELIASVLGEV